MSKLPFFSVLAYMKSQVRQNIGFRVFYLSELEFTIDIYFEASPTLRLSKASCIFIHTSYCFICGMNSTRSSKFTIELCLQASQSVGLDILHQCYLFKQRNLSWTVMKVADLSIIVLWAMEHPKLFN